MNLRASFVRPVVIGTVSTFNFCTKCVGSPCRQHGTSPIAIQFPGNGCMDDLTTERSFESQATWTIDVFGLFLLFMSVCATTQRQASCRPVQELNVCTVPYSICGAG